jgi:hypothetical protein
MVNFKKCFIKHYSDLNASSMIIFALECDFRFKVIFTIKIAKNVTMDFVFDIYEYLIFSFKR